MDRSRLSAAIPDIRFARDPGEAAGADVVVVDLARHADAIRSVREVAPAARIVGFGPHVDDATMRRAQTDGADLVVPRSRFFRDPASAVAPPA
jgi:hypothetical protein